jgi:enoyl-CoA hydratase/carnithine racemase
MAELALFERKGRVAIVTINRPEKRNAVDIATSAALKRCFDEVERNPDIDVCIFTGAGDKAFSAGVDLKQLAQEGPPMVPKVFFPDTGWAGIGRRRFDKPVIAAVNGHAIAGGLELMLSCDFAIAAENAMFGVNEAALGPIADAGACFRLRHWIPLPYAKELLYTGRWIDAPEALRLGLVNRVVTQTNLMPTCLEIAQRIAKNSREAVGITKRLINETLDRPEDEAWTINERYMWKSFENEDFWEGPRAFAEKRPPAFKRDR